MYYKIILKSIISIILGILILSTSCYKDDGNATVTINFKGNSITTNSQEKHIIDRILGFFNKPAYAAWDRSVNRLTLTVSGESIKEQPAYEVDMGRQSIKLVLPAGNNVSFKVLSFESANDEIPNWGGIRTVSLRPGNQSIDITMIPMTKIISAEQWVGTGNSVTIKFDNINSACKGYNIYRSTEENSNYVRIYSSSKESYTLNPDQTISYEDTANLDIYKTYYYKVSVISNSGVEGLLCAAELITTTNTVAKPTANLSGGSVAFGTEVTLSSTPNAEIYYTLDGSEPSSSGILYTGPITLNTLGTITLKAIAVKSGMNDSAILEAEYTPGIEMVLIPNGTFIMGSDDTDDVNAQPAHSVILTKDFYMSKYLVTQELYIAVMGSNPSSFNGGPGKEPASGEVQGKRPVEWVNWYRAIVFCNRLSMQEGLSPVYRIPGFSNSTDPDVWGTVPADSNATWNAVEMISGANGYRLPTEAEWEYACRAGTTTAYNTGDTINDNTGWHSGNTDKTHQVGKKPANNWGLYDMHGNVMELCWDVYDANYYLSLSSPSSDPIGPASGVRRVMRGGSWTHDGQTMRSAYRQHSAFPSDGSSMLGLRLVRGVP